MRNILKVLLTILLFSNYLTVIAQKSIVIFFDNDVHCNIEGYRYMAGMRQCVSADTAYVALVSAGDFIQGGTIGAISKGEAVVKVIKEAQYDAVTVGNHEFDYDAEYTKKLMKEYDVPVVCCNFVDTLGNAQFKPYIICNYGDKKIAYVGVTTPNTFYSKLSSFMDLQGRYVYNFCRYNIYDVVQKAVDDARAENADYVVVLSHIGEARDSIGICSQDLIAKTKGIDALIDGHTHSIIGPKYIKNVIGEDVLVAQTGTQFANIGKLVIDADGRVSGELIPCFTGNLDLLNEDKHVAQVVDSITMFYQSITSVPVGHSSFDLLIEDENDVLLVRKQENQAGNLVSDAIRLCTNADVALVNGGAIRNSCHAGNLKRGDIIGMCPYDNDIISLVITGQQIIDVLNSSIRYLPEVHGNFPQVSGISFKINVTGDHNNFVSDVKILNPKNGKYTKIKKKKNYRFATTNYFIGSEEFQVLKNQCSEYINHHISYSQAVIDLIHDVYQGEIPISYSRVEGRIIL